MEEESTRKLAVLLHADVVGSTALVQLDETLAHHRIQDAFRRFSKLISSHGGVAHELRGDLGLAYYTARQYPAALDTLQEAISRHPAFLFPRKALAATLAQLGRQNEAQAVVEALLEHPDASIRRGDVYVLGTAPESQGWSAHWIEGLRKAGMPE